MRALAACSLLLVAGCSEQGPSIPTTAGPISPAVVVAKPQPPARFAGIWRVTAVSGAPAPGVESPILVTLDSGSAKASADCAFLGDLRHRLEGEMLRLSPPPPGIVGSCARGLSPLENAFTRVFRAGATVRRAGETLLIEHEGRTATLVRRPAPPARLALLETSAVGDAAMLTGWLEAEAGCLYLRVIYGARFLPAFTTAETRWDASTGVLHVGDKQFTSGSRVRLGGSFARETASLAWRQAPDPACVASRTWIAASVDPDISARQVAFTGEEIERMKAEDAAK